MRLTLLAASLGLIACPLEAEVEIHQSGDRVSLTAVSAPVAEILDRLARQTGMKVVYDAQPPRQLITARLEQRTTAEAVLGIMEGLGFNYALVMDLAGTHVDQLLILGPVGVAPPAAVGGPAPAPAPPPRRPEPPQLEVDDEADQLAEDEFEEDDESPARETPAPGASAPAGMPGPPPPDYPSSSFTPKLPTPVAPPPSAQPPGGGSLPTPQPAPTPNPR